VRPHGGASSLAHLATEEDRDIEQGAEVVDAKNASTKTAAPEDEFFDDAEDTFPGKEDLKNRLVAVYALDRGTDTNAEGKSYPFVTTVTLVLDDGPDGWSPTSFKNDEQVPNLVPSVAENGPQEINLRWSTEGMVARLDQRIGKTWKPMIGRINSRPNSQKGRSASWSISKPTEDDKVIARPFVESHIKPISERLEAEANKDIDKAAFDES
jgi:hypothetical protein